jgi:uncharacterized protein (TIGR02001 family)
MNKVLQMNPVIFIFIIATSIGSLASVAQAQTAPAPAAEPESTLAFNAGVISDYRYRGISQTRLDLALQGGVDDTDKSGVYVSPANKDLGKSGLVVGLKYTF